MFFNLRKIFAIISIPNVKYLHKYMYNMEKAYMRHISESSQFQLSFQYTQPELKVSRTFNFSRQLSEPVSTFLSRVTTNVEKVLTKKSKKKKPAESSDDKSNSQVNVSLLVNSAEVDGATPCNEVFKSEHEVVLKVNDNEFNVVINSPWIDGIALPKSILANFPVYPAKFDAVFTDKKLSEYKWFRSTEGQEWIEVGNSYIYTPSNRDINCYLKFACIPKCNDVAGPLTEVISENVVDASPGLCPFELRHNFTKERAIGKVFRVVTYNILADLYCDSDFTRTELYPYCPPYALNIDYRKQLIVKELLGYNADIICLQEVDRKVFNYDLNPIFSHLGYESDFCIKGGQVAEGLACFFDSSRFKQLESHRIVLGEEVDKNPIFADIWEKIQVKENLAERFRERTTTVQINVLEAEENGILAVANTHLYFHPDADHIRLLQGGLAIRYVNHVINDLKHKYPGKRISLIFCGDFNSVPECGIYKLYTTGDVPPDFVDYRSNAEEAVENIHLQQPFHLASACGKPKYTNFTAGFADCLDYIYYDETSLEVIQYVPLPTDEELQQNTALPSIVFPSDHISLIADLKWL